MLTQSGYSIDEQNAQCLDCHQGGELIEWTGSVHEIQQLHRKMLQEYFLTMDDDGSGKITYVELAGMIREELLLGVEQLPDLEIKRVWVALDKDGWRDEQRPFTFTGLPDADRLEFVIKSYPSHDGVTEQIADLKPGDSVLIEDPWGAIEDKGPGTFIAGGAGITPFIAILRARHAREGSLAGCQRTSQLNRTRPSGE